ncbi:MAG: MATE family efflux transporter [Ruminococcaceae bacterium]|nr:MATE family efflux transporter [Oscillospiraceae bacterium]
MSERRSIVQNNDYMLTGSISKSIVKFAVPLFFGNLFQQLYNTADSLIVGRVLGNTELAAVSSTGMLIFLLVGFFQGIGLGAGVVVSQFFGAKDTKNIRLSIHTYLTFSLIIGAFLTVAATLLAPIILQWMGTPREVMPDAVEYIRVYFMGSLALVMYNACMGIMQAVGDSKHPLYYLIVSSLINVVLDIILIACFGFGVWAAALATVISQFVSVFLCLLRLFRSDEEYSVRLKELTLNPRMLGMIMRIGLPSGVQNSIIAFANVVVQSNINYFGEMAMAGCGAYSKIEGFAFLPITSFTAAITTFVGQNLGAGNKERVKKGARFGLICSLIIAEIIGVLFYIFARFLISAFTDEPEAILYGVQKAQTCALFYFLLAATHSFASVLRGAGKSVFPMLTMLVCWCVIRVGFLLIVVPITQTIHAVNWVYPLTWSLSTITLFIYYLVNDWSDSSITKKGKSL